MSRSRSTMAGRYEDKKPTDVASVGLGGVDVRACRRVPAAVFHRIRRDDDPRLGQQSGRGPVLLDTGASWTTGDPELVRPRRNSGGLAIPGPWPRQARHDESVSRHGGSAVGDSRSPQPPGDESRTARSTCSARTCRRIPASFRLPGPRHHPGPVIPARGGPAAPLERCRVPLYPVVTLPSSTITGTPRRLPLWRSMSAGVLGRVEDVSATTPASSRRIILTGGVQVGSGVLAEDLHAAGVHVANLLPSISLDAPGSGDLIQAVARSRRWPACRAVAPGGLVGVERGAVEQHEADAVGAPWARRKSATPAGAIAGGGADRIAERPVLMRERHRVEPLVGRQSQQHRPVAARRGSSSSPAPPPCQTGSTVWITRGPEASAGGDDRLARRQSADPAMIRGSRRGSPGRRPGWMALSMPPPPIRVELARSRWRSWPSA